MFKKAVEILRLNGPSNHWTLASANQAIGQALYYQDQNSEARQYSRKSHQIRLNSFLQPDNHQTLAMQCSNYRAILLREVQHEQALKEYEKALAIELMDHPPIDPTLEPIYY
jgi:tetratricopeptide (TPR) repeat protein